MFNKAIQRLVNTAMAVMILICGSMYRLDHTHKSSLDQNSNGSKSKSLSNDLPVSYTTQRHGHILVFGLVSQELPLSPSNQDTRDTLTSLCESVEADDTELQFSFMAYLGDSIVFTANIDMPVSVKNCESDYVAYHPVAQLTTTGVLRI